MRVHTHMPSPLPLFTQVAIGVNSNDKLRQQNIFAWLGGGVELCRQKHFHFPPKRQN